MSSQSNEEVKVPNFDGEAMKMPENTDLVPEASAPRSVTSGPLLVILAVLLFIILGGLYYWFSLLETAPAPITITPIERPTIQENNEPESTTAEAQVDALSTVSTSNELQAIEADIESTNLDGLDEEMTDIEAEMNAEMGQ